MKNPQYGKFIDINKPFHAFITIKPTPSLDPDLEQELIREGIECKENESVIDAVIKSVYNGKSGVYKISNPVGQIYIGQSSNIGRRITGHKCSKNASTKINQSIAAYGFESHVVEVLEYCSKEDLRHKERFWQDFYRSNEDSGLNIILTKSGYLKGSCQLVQVEAMRKANIGSSKAGMHSQVFKDKQRERLKGKCLNPHHNKKVIIQMDMQGEVIKEWESLSEACGALKINIGNTGMCALGKQYKSSGGFKWKYKQQENEK